MAYRQFGPLEAMMHVQQQGEMGRQRGEQSRLGRLVSQGMSEPGGLAKIAPEVASFNPDAAFALQDRASSQLDKRREALTSRARVLSAMPTQQRAQVWPSIKAELAAVDPELGAALPDMYDEAQFGPVIEQLAGLSGGQPAQMKVFEAQARAAGLQPGSPEYQKAAQIALGLQGRASSAGMGFDMVEDAQGVPRPQRRDPRTGTVEVFISEQNAWVPLGGGMGQQQPRQQPQDKRYPTAMVLENEQGEPDPFNDLPPTVRAEADRLAKAGQPFHIANGRLVRGLSPGVTNQPTQQPVNQSLPSIMDVGGGDPAFNSSPFGRGRTKEQEAAAVEAAKRRTSLEFSGAEAEADANKARLKKEAEAQADRVINAPGGIQKATETIALIDLALNHPGRETATGASGMLDPRNYIPGTDATDFRVILDQLGGRAFLEAFESLKGGGQITEVEGRKATEAMARLNRAQSDEAFRAALNDLRDVALSAKARAEMAGGATQQTAAPADDDVDALIGKYL